MYSQSATYIYIYSVDVYYMMFTIHIICLYTHIPYNPKTDSLEAADHDHELEWGQDYN